MRSAASRSAGVSFAIFVSKSRLHWKVRSIYELYHANSNLALMISTGPHKDTQDLQVPVIYALACKLWDIEKQFHVREPIKGYGRLLEELP